MKAKNVIGSPHTALADLLATLSSILGSKSNIALAAISLMVLSACGGLAGEPQIVSTAPLPTVTPTAPPDLGHPPARVNLARGAEIFGGPQGCANCHGIGGRHRVSPVLCPISPAPIQPVARQSMPGLRLRLMATAARRPRV